MTNRSVPAIDLTYRPRTYFWAEDMNIKLSSGIKGSARKLMYERSVADASTLPTNLTKTALTGDERQAWGRLHPRLMGGEYLPDCNALEVEIARIAIASTTSDVTSVYARASRDRIHYRVVDEYGGGTLSARSTRTSLPPLALGELVDFFMRAWDLLAVLDMNFEADGYPPAEVHGFVTDASSSFYAQFGALISARIEKWLKTVRAPSRAETGGAQ